MSGPLHGGAPSRVLHMIEEVERSGDADAYVKGVLDRGERGDRAADVALHARLAHLLLDEGRALLDAALEYLPAATVTERPAGEREDTDDTPWSPV